MAEFIPNQSDTELNNEEEMTPGEVHNNENEDELETESGAINLMKQYENVVEDIFSSFKELFSKNYKSSHEHEKRKNIFRHNMR